MHSVAGIFRFEVNARARIHRHRRRAKYHDEGSRRVQGIPSSSLRDALVPGVAVPRVFLFSILYARARVCVCVCVPRGHALSREGVGGRRSERGPRPRERDAASLYIIPRLWSPAPRHAPPLLLQSSPPPSPEIGEGFRAFFSRTVRAGGGNAPDF